MQTFATALMALAGALVVSGQGVTDKIPPPGVAPAGCSPDFDGRFLFGANDILSNKRDLIELPRAQCGDGPAVVTLKDGIMTDALNRTGYIASNFQFQFDGPPQAGAIFTAGFSACSNGSIALGPTTVFFRCVSGDFSNLYDRHWAHQCYPVELHILPCGEDSGGAAGAVGQSADGQVVATQIVTTTVMKVLPDGQPQVITTTLPVPMCQIGDGQIQVHTAPCADVPAAAQAAPASQIADGQVQVTPAAAVTQISDGQVQVTAPGATASQISDGQIQVTPSSAPPAKSSTVPPAPVHQGDGCVVRGSAAALVGGLAAALVMAI